MSWLFGHVEKRLDSKYKVDFKIYDTTTWKTNNDNTHIAQYLKKQRQLDKEICQLIEYNISIFFRNDAQNVVEKQFPDPFLKNQSWAYLLINCSNFYLVCFYCMPSVKLLKYMEAKLQTPCFLLHIKLLKKQKEVWNYLYFVRY